MPTRLVATALCLLLPAMLVVAAAPPELEPLAFLLGEWVAVPTGRPDEPTGRTTFSRDLQERVIVRRNVADYPASGQTPGSRHEDLMVIYAAPDGTLRADYHDSEGHAIRYRIQVPEAGRAVFVSEEAAGLPGFRLSYRLEGDGSLAGTFEIASPGEPEAFQPYLAWESRRAEAAGE